MNAFPEEIRTRTSAALTRTDLDAALAVFEQAGHDPSVIS